jgi:nucleotide-binding universal stress UspA family protein
MLKSEHQFEAIVRAIQWIDRAVSRPKAIETSFSDQHRSRLEVLQTFRDQLSPRKECTMFKKILVPLDGSELAAKILPNVVELAKCMQSQIILLHVCYWPIPTGAELLAAKLEQEVEEKLTKECAIFLGKAAKELQLQGLNVTHECVEGVPAREIVAYAEANKIDLIAMATHGRGEVAWVLGSTAEKVVTHATVPTLLFKVMETKIPEFKDSQKWRRGMP